jgi:hypothetical protein
MSSDEFESSDSSGTAYSYDSLTEGYSTGSSMKKKKDEMAQKSQGKFATHHMLLAISNV